MNTLKRRILSLVFTVLLLLLLLLLPLLTIHFASPLVLPT